MAAHGDELEHACSARRRRERRLRAWWRHEQFAIRCAVASATHHSGNRSRRVDAETQTAHVVFPQERITERIMEQTCDAPVPQDDRVCGARTCRHQKATPDQARRARTCPYPTLMWPVQRPIRGSNTCFQHLPASAQRVRQGSNTCLQHQPSPLRLQLQ